MPLRVKKYETTSSQSLHRLAFEFSPLPMWILDATTFRFLAVNRAAVEFYGHSEEDFLSLTLSHICVSEKENLPYAAMSKRKSPQQFTCIHKLRSGASVAVSVNSKPVTVNNQQAYIETITERAGKAETPTDEQIRILTDTSAAGFFFYADDRFHYINPAMEAISGYTLDEFRSMRFLDLIHPDHHRMIRQRARSRNTNAPLSSRYEVKILTKNGEIRWLDVAPGILQLNGKRLLVGTAIDITKRKQMEEELQRSEELTHRILEAVPGGIVEADFDGRVLQANLEAQRMFGLGPVDFLRVSMEELAGMILREDGTPLPPNEFPLIKCLSTGEEQPSLAIGIRRNDGSVTWGVCTSVPITDVSSGEIAGAVLTVLDITQRKQAEDALRESEERYRQFFEDDLTGDFIADVKGTISSCNEAFATIFGFESPEAAMQSNLETIFESPAAFQETLSRLITERKIEYNDRVARRPDGRPVYVVENLIGLFDSSNTMTGIRGYVFDNTAHKMLEHHLQEAARLEGLGRLAGGIAHDFNNLLSIILGYSERLMQTEPSSPSLVNDVQAIYTAARRGANLVKQLLTFARKAQIAFSEMNVNDVLDELARLLRETFPKAVTFQLAIDHELPLISGDHNQIHQAVLNLCVNARDAMPAGGLLTLQSFKTSGSQLRARFPEATANEYVGIAVSDTGSGMDEQTRRRIFEPFFTTKELGRGTGLGLAVVHGIVQSHNGFVDVVSERGVGTTFTLYFPTLLGRESQHMEENVGYEPPGGSETILLVEDEELLRDLVESLLQSKGYTVVTARDGQEAVEIFMKDTQRINLVVTDLGLPRLGGWEAVRIMLKERKNLPVLVATGYLDPDARSEMTCGGIQEFVSKPYQGKELLARIREVLDKAAAS